MESSDSPALVGYNVRFGANGQNQNFKSMELTYPYGTNIWDTEVWRAKLVYMALSLKGSPDQRSYFGIPKGWYSYTHPAEIKLFW